MKKKSFTRSSILLTTILLGEKPIGRYNLSMYLGLSLAKTRAILNYLVEIGVASTKGKSSGKIGTGLTKSGFLKYLQLRNIFRIYFNTSIASAYIDSIQVHHKSVMIIFESNQNINNGIYERDIAVRNGATGAITLIHQDNNWQFPDGFNFNNEFFNNLDYSAKFNSCIIVFGPSLASSANGVIQIAEYHLLNQILAILRY